MPSFNPLSPLQTMDGHPLKDGTVSDPSARAAITKLRGEWLAAAESQKGLLEVRLTELSEQSMDVMTVGSVIIKSLTDALKGDEDLPATTKLDNYELALRVRRAVDHVEITNTELDNIKSRLAKVYPSALVVGQVLGAIVVDDAKVKAVAPLAAVN